MCEALFTTLHHGVYVTKANNEFYRKSTYTPGMLKRGGGGIVTVTRGLNDTY